MSNKIKVLFIANYLEALQRSMRYKGISADFLSGCSPLAMAGNALDENLKYCKDINHRPTLLNLRKNLSNMLTRDRESYCQNYNFVPTGENVKYSNDADYIVIMNTCSAYRLSEKDGVVYSDTWPKNSFTNYIENSKEYRQLAFPFPESFNWQFYYDKFIDAILSEYDCNHIILIRTNSSQWFMDNSEIRSQNSGSVAYRDRVEEMDRYFMERTGCLCIDEHYNHIPVGDQYSAFRYSNPMSPFTYRQLQKSIENILLGNISEPYRYNMSHYANKLASCLDMKLSSNIRTKYSVCIDTVEERRISFKGIEGLAEENVFFGNIIKLKRFFTEKNYTLSDYFSELDENDCLEHIDVELIELYVKYMRLNINDVIAVWFLYCKSKDKKSFRAVIDNIVNNSDCSPVYAAKSFREANIEYLKNYAYIHPDLKDVIHSEKKYIYLDNNTFLVLDLNAESPIEKITVPIAAEANYKKVIENGYVCPVTSADALCSSLAFYIERAKLGNGNTPVRIEFSSAEEFSETLSYIGYTDILENERFVITLKDKPYVPDNYVSRCNLEFLFEDNAKICVIRAGFTDQMCSYIYSKRLAEKQGVKMYYDDTHFFLKNTFNGFELDKVATEDLSNKRLTKLLSYKLLEKWVKGESLAGVLYQNGVYTLGGVGVDGRIKMFEQCNRTLIPISADNPETIDILLNYNSGFRPEYHHNMIRPELLMLSEKYDVEKYIRFSEFADEINKNIAEQMRSSDSIAIHIRLGDFASLGWDSDTSYYIEAINKIMTIEDYKNKKYFIFSDDIPWVKTHTHEVGLDLVGNDEIVYVDNNKDEESYRDMQLMTYAKVIIGSGSGFVRMAALLSKSCEMFLCYNVGVMDLFKMVGRKNKYDVGGFSKNYFVDYSVHSPKSSDSARVVQEQKQTPQQNPAVSRLEIKTIKGRESVEWLNFWFDNANEQRNDRILLIGDSVAREYRGPLAKLIQKPVDFFASSSDLSNEKFFKELELFFSYEEYRQKKAHIQIGVHGINGFWNSAQTNSIEEYERGFERLIATVTRYISDLTIALTTPVVQQSNLSALDDKINDEIIRRNQAVKKIAEKHNLPVNDLYALMLTEPHRDDVHFPKEGSEKIARKVAEVMKLI